MSLASANVARRRPQTPPVAAARPRLVDRAPGWITLALALTAAALLARHAATPWIGGDLPFVTLFVAVAVAVSIGGYRPAALVALLGWLGATILFVEPHGASRIDGARQAVGAGLCWITCVTIIALGERVRRARRRSESSRARLEESERRFRSIAEHAPVHFWLDDEHGRCTFADARLLALAGGIGDTPSRWTDAIHPDDREGHLAAYRAAVAARREHHAEVRVGRADGDSRWFRLDARPRFEAQRFAGYIGSATDVTERKAAGLTLRASEQRLRTMAHATPAFIWTADPGGRITFQNERWLQYTGLTPEQNARHWTRLVLHPDDHDRCVTAWQHALETGADFEIEVRYRRHDGEHRWFLTRATAIRDDQDRVVEWFGSTTDIHERRLGEESLRERERRFREVADTAPAMLWVTAPDGNATFLSRAWSEYTGQAPAAALGLGWLDAVHPDDRVRAARALEEAIARRGPFTLDYRLRRADGEYRWAIDAGRPRFGTEGEFLGYIGSVIDVHERRRAEDTLRANEARLATELDAMRRLHALSTRLLVTDDLHAALGDVLDNAIAACGADFGNVQLLDLASSKLAIVVHRGVGAEFLEHFREVGGADGSVCARAMRAAARVAVEDVDVDPEFAAHRAIALAAGFRAVQSTPLLSHGGEIVGMLSTHWRTSRELDEREERLLDLYARHAADLVERFRIQAALAQADRRKDEFLATLAHELRNPLAPIRNAAHVLRLRGPLDEQLAHCRDVIERQVAQMARLLDDLLDLGRITSDKVELRRSAVTLASVLETAIETSRPLLEAAGHRFAWQMPSVPVLVLADPVRLAQVFANVLNNAAKYTERGGQVGLRAAVDGDDVVVTVQDDGIGIAQEQLPRIFDMFAQTDAARARGQGGLGIGLSLARRLVELHGGTIAARSDGIGRGSEFVVRMPRLRDGAAVELAGAPPAGGDRDADGERRGRILVADDNADSTESLAMLLRAFGHDVQTALDGHAAIAVAEQFRPSVALLDLGMPELDGYEVARRLRALPWGPALKLVAISGWGQPDDRRRAREAGFDHHCVKPVDGSELESLLAKLLADPIVGPRA